MGKILNLPQTVRHSRYAQLSAGSSLEAAWPWRNGKRTQYRGFNRSGRKIHSLKLKRVSNLAAGEADVKLMQRAQQRRRTQWQGSISNYRASQRVLMHSSKHPKQKPTVPRASPHQAKHLSPCGPADRKHPAILVPNHFLGIALQTRPPESQL